MAQSISGIDHVQIGVRDLEEACQAFARLGFEVSAADGGLSLIFGRDHLALTLSQPLGLNGVGLASREAGPASQPLPEGTTPGMASSLCRPQPAGTVEHPNGVGGIASLTLLAARPEDWIAGYDKLFGHFASTPTDEMITVHSGGAMIFVVTPDGFDHLHPQIMTKLPEPPAMVALSLAVKSLAQAESVLAANGVRFRRQAASLAIDPADCLGLGLEFVAE